MAESSAQAPSGQLALLRRMRARDSDYPRSDIRHPLAGMRLSSARLAALFVLIFAAGVTLLLTIVYILTARVLDREVDAVISSEAGALIDDYARGGLLSLVLGLVVALLVPVVVNRYTGRVTTGPSELIPTPT